MVPFRIGIVFFALFLMGGTCKPLPEDKSSFAAASGNFTVALGSTCRGLLKLGFDSCYLERGKKFPVLMIGFTNPGEYAISDCELNIFRQGAKNESGILEIDLSPLAPQAEKNGFCLLKIEVIEKYQDSKDENQTHQIPLKGGFFIEMLSPGYNPRPTRDDIAFCEQVKIARTTKGRTVIESESCQ